MSKIRVAVIGQGRSGRNIHTEHLKQDDRFRIMAVVDALPERRERAARDYGCDVYADFHELFARKDLDLVVNSTFSHLHVPVTLELLQAGFNVLCEKPLAARAAEVDQVIEAAQKSGKLLAVYQNSRYAPYFEKVREVIDSGVLGRIVQIAIQFNGFSRRWDWQTLREWNGGNLMNTGPHPLDQALVLFGPGEPEVRCFMDRTEEGSSGTAENHVKLLLSGRGHPVIDLEISSCCAYPSFTYNVYGSRGGMKGTTSAMEWRYFIPGDEPQRPLDKNPIQNEEGLPVYLSEKMTWHTGRWPTEQEAEASQAEYSSAAAPVQGGMTRKFYSMLHRTLTEGVPLEVTLEQVRRQIAVIEEAHRQNPQIYGSSD